jgi:PAS domain S-box-containing protein
MLLYYEVHSYRLATARNLSTTADIIAANSTAVLIFDDQKLAQQILSGLRVDSDITAAAFFDQNGKLYATYPADLPASAFPKSPESGGIKLQASQLNLFKPVIQGQSRVGTLYLQANLNLSRHLKVYGLVLFLILAGSGIVALFLSNFFQRQISQPLSNLAEVAKTVSNQKDYSMRAVKASNDELGDLTEAFNSMLNQIETSHSQLFKSEEQLRMVADHASVFLCQFDREHRFRFVNRTFAERFNLEPSELIGKHLSEVMGKLAYESVRPRIDETFTGKKMDFEMEIQYATLGSRWIHAIYMPERNWEGQVVGIVAVISDITERKRADQVSRELAAIVESSDDAIISKNLNGIVATWNHGAERLFGYSANEIIGRSITILIPLDRHDEESKILGCIRRGDRIENYETIRQRKDGKRIEIALTVSPIRDATGKIIGASKIAHDISRQKQTERDLERAHQEAVAASRAKDDFLAALSHELRTPLNPVLLVASDAASNSQLPEEARADFEMIRRNVELEARLIDDLLDLTRITRGKMSLDKHSLDVHVVLQEAVETVRADAEKKQIEIALNFNAAEHNVFGDAVRLQQVFWNVLKNAVKFTPETGKIIVKTFAEDSTLFIKVIDTGIGMNSDELKRVFNAFSQGDHAADGGPHRFGGLGLGLAISRMLIELHSGSIHASSEGSGQGATFLIQLPLAKITKENGTKNLTITPSLPSPANTHAQPLRILLVEDHEPTRTALTHLLARRRYEVTSTASLAEARAVAGKQNFNILISDIGLPDGSGYDLMTEFRECYGLKGIALTGYGMEQDVARSRESGFVAHLTKPVKMESLDNALSSILHGRLSK